MPKSSNLFSSPLKQVTTGQTELAEMNFHVIPDVHGNYLTLIKQCMQSIQSFKWDNALMNKYSEASKVNKSNIQHFMTNDGHYNPNYVEFSKENVSSIYNKIDGHDFIQDLKRDLDQIQIDEADKLNEMVFAGDLLADRETNTLHMLYTFKALSDKGVNYKIIYSNHDEIFFKVFGKLKPIYDQFDSEKLTDLAYVKAQFIKPLRRFVSNEININPNYIMSYVSLLQFAFTIEKQIYDLNQENRVLANEEKQSLLSGFAEVDAIINDVYLPHLKIAYLKDLTTSKGQRPYLITHAPQAIMDLKDAYVIVLQLMRNPIVENIEKVLNIVSIYSKFQSGYQTEIQQLLNALSHLSMSTKASQAEIKKFVMVSSGQNIEDPHALKQLAKQIIYSRVTWFTDRVFKLHLVGQRYEENFSAYLEDRNNNDVKNALFEIMYSVSKHMLNTPQQIENDFFRVLFSNIMSLNVIRALEGKSNLSSEEKQILEKALDAVNGLLIGIASTSNQPRYLQKVSSLQQRQKFELLEKIPEIQNDVLMIDHLDTSVDGWQENEEYKQILAYLFPALTSDSQKKLIALNNKPEQKHLVKDYLQGFIKHRLLSFKNDINEVGYAVLLERFHQYVYQNNFLPKEETTSLFGLWKNMVASAYQNDVNNQELKNMYEILQKKTYAKVLQDLLLDLPNDQYSERYVEISKQMVDDINRLIEIDPSLLYQSDVNGEPTDIQNSLYSFVWNRHEIMGDQSGQSLVTHIYGHTGNADLDAKDDRCTQISLDNLSSKYGDGSERIKFSANASENKRKSYCVPAKPIGIFLSPVAENKRRRMADENQTAPDERLAGYSHR